MLFIDEEHKVPLPEKYHLANNVCAIIFDHLTEILSSEYYAQMHGTSIDLSGLDELLIARFNEGPSHALDILAQLDRNDALETVLTKHITMSILSDFCHFVYESISNAQRGKITVAYALLRKPFVDELLMFEQLLNDSKEFVNLYFHIGNPKEYDPSGKKLDRNKIVFNSVASTKNPINAYLSADFIYELRYDKSSSIGINGLSNQALHIVTNDSNYKTDNQELNFVFNNDVDIDKFWSHYYSFVPMLLIYAARIVDNIVLKFIDNVDKEANFAAKELKRLIGFSQIIKGESKSEMGKVFEALGNEIVLSCPKCQHTSKVDTEEDYIIYLYENVFLCSQCAEPFLTEEAMNQLRKLITTQD